MGDQDLAFGEINEGIVIRLTKGATLVKLVIGFETESGILRNVLW
jgi:hypothetical protein